MTKSIRFPASALALVLSIASSVLAAPAFAAYPLVVCGNEDPRGNTELDNLTVYRGGTYGNQVVLRNQNIIDDFVAKGAIYRGELNGKGEFIIGGLGSPSDMHGEINNRAFNFFQDGDAYVLMVQLIAPNHIDLSQPIAEFRFRGDCQATPPARSF